MVAGMQLRKGCETATPMLRPDQAISACLIVRDEAITLRAALESVRPYVSDLICVDTGSIDDSPAIARDLCDQWECWTECNDEAGRILDFAAARNRALSLAKHDWMLWLDGDDILVGGEHLCELTQPERVDGELDVVVLPYEYAHDATGRCSVLQYRERLVWPARDFRWQCPVHEGCLPKVLAGRRLRTRGAEHVRLIHRHPAGKPREPGRNLRILEDYVARSGEGDPRALFYLGLERTVVGQLDAAQAILERYVELSDWADELCLAMLELSKLHSHAQRWEPAISWALKASQEKSWPAPYFALGRIYYSMARAGIDQPRNFRRAARHFELGLTSVGHVSTVLLQHPLEAYEIERHLNVVLSAIGDLEGAIRSCQRGLSGLPSDEGLAGNLAIYERELKKSRVISMSRELCAARCISAEALALIEGTVSGAARVSLQPEPAVAPPSLTAGREPAPGAMRVVLYVGHGLEPWTPESLERTGMGGSETMAWLVARELDRRGHAVRVYGHLDGPAIDWGRRGQWLDAADYHDLDCDVLITSRQPAAIDANVRARARILWVHDVHCGHELTPERAQRLDAIWGLTEWHTRTLKQVYPWLQPDKVRTLRNAIDMDVWELVGEDVPSDRNPHRAVYSSSPDRGLPLALELWPRVREQVPDAELHVYYGFDNWRKVCMVHPSGGEMLQELESLERRCKSTPGVVLHGRVSERELAAEFWRSGVWAYPTWWLETSCITAMQAHAAGLVIVTSNIAGLYETAHQYSCKLSDEYGSQDYRDKWVAKVVEAMTDRDVIGSARCVGPQFARERFGLPGLMDMMETQIRELVAAPVVPAFSEEGL